MLNLEYLPVEGVASYLKQHADHALGVIAFGGGEGLAPALQPVPLHVQVPLLGAGDTSCEVWTSSQGVSACGEGNIQAQADGEVLFGSMRLIQGAQASLLTVAREAYQELFALIDRLGYRNLLRTWNYVPRINEAEDGLERYRCFNVGRHEAYVASGRNISEENIPAASVLGCQGDFVVLYFIAARAPGKPVDNPRQLAAYKYPERYGPRSPIFVRAMQAEFGAQSCLFISGTASIVGHETLHEGDVKQQARETMLNIRTLLQEAYPEGLEKHDGGRIKLKAYVRNQPDLEVVREQIALAFGAAQQSVYVQADICRSDLLLEVEGVYFGG